MDAVPRYPNGPKTRPVDAADPVLREGLVRITRDSLRPLVLGLAALFALFAGSHPVMLPSDQALPLSMAASLSAGVFVALYMLLRHWQLPLEKTNALLAGVAVLVLANLLLYLYVTDDPTQTIYVMLALPGMAFFLLARRWLAGLLALTWIGWVAVMWGAVGPDERGHFALGLLAATLLAVMVHVVRQRTLLHLESLRVQDDLIKRDLGTAIWHAQQEETRFQQLAGAAFEGILFHDQGRILDVNPALAFMFGYEPTEMIGHPLTDYVAPESRARLLDKIESDDESIYELRAIRRGGVPFSVEVRGKSVPYQGRLVRVAAVRDITLRKQAEDALLRAKERAEQLYRVVPSAVFTVDRDGLISSLNDKAAQVLGYAPDELIGKPCTTFALPPCGGDCDLFDEGPVVNQECSIRTKTGEIRMIIKNGEVLRDRDGNPTGGIESFEDITERKRVEHELRKLSQAVEQGSNAIMITDADGMIEYVNPHFTAITGYTAAEVVGRTPNIQKSGQTPRDLYDELWETIEAGGEWRGEILNKKKNGDLYWEFSSISPIRDEDGRITHFLAVKEDITARKQAETALQESLFRTQILYNASHALLAFKSLPELLQAVVDNIAAALYADRVILVTLDLEAQRIVHFVRGGPGVSQVIETAYDELWDGLTGWVLRENRPVLSPRDEPDPRESADVQQRRLETNCGDIIVVPVQFLDRATVGTLTAINARTGRDLTHQDVELMMALANQSIIAIENARLLDSLRQSEEKFSKAFRASPDPVMISTLDDGRFVDANDAFTQVLGYSRDEVIGYTLDDLEIWGQPAEREQFDALVRDYDIVRNFEMPFRRKSGEIGYALMSSEIIELDGTPCVLTIAKDITDRKKAAAEREQLILELDAFGRTVAHDLKAPLSPILGYAEMLIDDGDRLTPEVKVDFLREIQDSGRRMGNIIDELLMLAQMRQSDVQPKPLDMGRIINEAQKRLAYMIKDYQPVITQPEKWPRAMGYASWIEEVWVNYISNGLKYGGQPPCLELGADVQPDGFVCYWVRDNGPGIAPDQQARLFTPFTQLEQVAVEGHGLGLSIVQRIVEKLDGQVGVESEVGQGSMFYFTLPAVP